MVVGLCTVLMVALVADVFVGVFSRYVLQKTFAWYDEIARLCFVWIVFLGAASAVRKGTHFRLHLLIDRFGVVPRRIVDMGIVFLVIAFGAVLVGGGVAILATARAQQTDAMEISMVWFYAALPVSGALMIIYAIPQLWRGKPLA